MNAALKNNLEFLAGGLSIIPIKLDGSKSPGIAAYKTGSRATGDLQWFGSRVLDAWEPYAERLPTETEVRDWFQGPTGTAVVCGAVSGGLEVIDFDYHAETIFPAWAEMVDPILIKLPVVETPGGGYHVYFRCDTIAGNQKIAMAEKPEDPDEKHEVLIESRGEGGYVVSVTSPPEVHENQYEYIQVAGPVLPEVPKITPFERDKLWKAGGTFDKGGLIEDFVRKYVRRKTRAIKPKSGDLTPWDDFDSRADPYQLLTGFGWTTSNGINWRHPRAKSSHGHSATLREASSGDPVLRVFSTSTALEADKSHSMFTVFTMLGHAGDWQAATKEARSQGYGK